MIEKSSSKIKLVLLLAVIALMISSCRRHKERCAAYDRVEVANTK